MPVVVEGRGMVLVLLRGDHGLNEIKLSNALGAGFRPAGPEEIEAELGPVGFIGPVEAGLPIVKDAAIQGDAFVTGANEADTHLRGVQPGRDFEFEEMDVRTVEAGDTALGGGAIEIEPAIEVGNIFQLGTRYSEPLGATYLDESGQERPIVMGSYGIGPARIAASAIEQGADADGIVWPASIAPFDVHIVLVSLRDPAQIAAAESIYAQCRSVGLDALLDDRDERPGVKFKDADLLGVPVRVTVGNALAKEGVVEIKERRAPRGERRVAPAAVV